MENFDNNKDLTLQTSSDETEEKIESKDKETKMFPIFCPERGNLVKNGSMEKFECGIPKGWKATIPCSVSKVTCPGHVHSGDSCAGLNDCAILKQKIDLDSNPSCFYKLAFYAQLEGVSGCLIATVTFLKGSEEILGGKIIVKGEDIPNCHRQFGYYTLITRKIPWGVKCAEIEFTVRCEGCQQINIDDVSCEALN